MQYGRIGTDGQTKTNEYENPAAAEAAAEKQVAEKVKKGYREVGGKPPVGPTRSGWRRPGSSWGRTTSRQYSEELPCCGRWMIRPPGDPRWLRSPQAGVAPASARAPASASAVGVAAGWAAHSPAQAESVKVHGADRPDTARRVARLFPEGAAGTLD